MPFNSQSPLILGLNALFSSPQANIKPGVGSKELRKTTVKLSQRAAQYSNIAPTSGEVQHINGWPQDHQDLMRWVLALSIDDDIPTSFAWEEVEQPGHTRTIIVSFGQKMGATFRSPYYI